MKHIPIDDALAMAKGGASYKSIARKFTVSEWTVRNRLTAVGYERTWKDGRLSEKDAVWVACVFDCEGLLTAALTFNKATQKHNIMYYGRVAMMTSAIPMRLHALCGGSYKDHRGEEKERACVYWNIGPSGLRWLLPQIIPFLLIKRDVAKLILDTLGRNGRGYRIPVSELEDFISKVRRLNKKGRDYRLDSVYEFGSV